MLNISTEAKNVFRFAIIHATSIPFMMTQILFQYEFPVKQ